MSLTEKQVDAPSLRLRYAELLRLREYVQRLENVWREEIKVRDRRPARRTRRLASASFRISGR